MRSGEGRAQFQRLAIKIGGLLSCFVIPRGFARSFSLLKRELGFICGAQEPQFDFPALRGQYRHRHFFEAGRPDAQSVLTGRDFREYEFAGLIRRAAPDFIQPHQRIRFRDDN